MLHLVTGPSGSGKTETVRNKLKTLAETGKEKLLLLVPEQYSFLTERGILETLGEKLGQKVEVLSFKRLSDYVFRELGGMAGQEADDATRIILMMRALSAVQDKLTVYGKQAENISLARELLLFVKELHRAGVTATQLKEVAVDLQKQPQGQLTLSNKLRDIALITEAYETLFFRNYTDEEAQTKRLCQKLEETNFFSGYTIVVDGFKGFTGQEQALLSHLVSQAEDVYLTLCIGNQTLPLFASVNHTKQTLNQIAKRSHKQIFLEEQKTVGIRFQNEELKFLEQHLFAPGQDIFSGNPEHVSLFEAEDLSSECNWIAATIRKLMREQGLRLKDIAVVVRNEDEYKRDLFSAFRRYQIPFFDDSRQPVRNQPLISMVLAVLSILTDGFTTENILQYLKTGLSPLSNAQVSALENYAYLWDLKAKDWQAEFTKHPDGLGQAETERSKNTLASLNRMREQIIIPLFGLKKAVKETNAEGISKAIYRFLQKTEVPDRLLALAKAYDKSGKKELAIEQNTVYEVLMNLFDRLSAGCGPEVLSIQAYGNLFRAVISMAEFASIPVTLDEVTVGGADRIRLDNPRVVFVAGLEEGIFPAVIGGGRLFSSRDRAILCQNGIELSLSEEDRASEELFIAYAAVTASTEQVFLSYHKIGAAGESLTPSDVIRSVIRCFGKTESGENKLAFQTAASLGPLYFAETKDSTFDTYAKASVSPQTAEAAASLRAAIPEDARLAALDTATGARAYQIADRSLATRLFGQDMGLSASRVEIYYQCAFRYFCQYGLRAKPRKRAALDPMQSGTIIHYVLENIIKNCTMKSLISMSDLERKAEVERWLSTYAQEQMGGLQDKTLRFTYLYRRLAVTLNDLISRLTEEFANSSFYPVDFELTIGPKEGKDGIPAYTLPLPDGGTLTINGSVDRVDSYQKDGQTYIRIVDYKTGGKDFALSEVICYGLNMQMLIYLFAIEQNGKERYGKVVPSGILYYPAKRAIFSLSNRNEAPEDIKKEKQKKELGSGLFLMDPAILDAMEHREDSQMAFRFLPVGKAVKSGIKLQDKNGAPEKGLICSEDLKKLHEKIDEQLIRMAECLHRGEIPANPARGKRHDYTCTYCDFRAICRLEEEQYQEDKAHYKEIKDINHQDALALLNGAAASDGKEEAQDGRTS